MKVQERKQLISVVIPAYGAEKVIVKTLTRIKETLDAIRYPYEIICVDDGSPDNTYKKALRFSNLYPSKVKVFGYKKNKGKGNAVRWGMAKAGGDIVGFVDVGMEINPNGISMLLEHFEWYGADIIIGSKRHPASKIYYPWYRKVLSFVYQVIVKIL